MIIEIKKNASKLDVNKAIRRLRQHIGKRKKDPFKYHGKLKMDIDPVKWQKQIRDEWD